MDILTDLRRSIPEEWKEEVLKQCGRYLFYYRDGRKCTRGFCTVCGREMEAFPTDTGIWQEFFRAKHNQVGICPVCGGVVKFKAEGRLRCGPISLDQNLRMLFVDVISPEVVWLRGYYIMVRFRSFRECPEVEFSEEVRYELTPGKAVMAVRTYSNLCGHTAWKLRKSIGEPWAISYNGNCIDYQLGNSPALAGTFLRYIPINEFYEREYPLNYRGYYTSTTRIPWGRILSAAARYTYALEMTVKYDLTDLWIPLVCHNNRHANHLNWQAKNAREFLRGVPKREVLAILQSNDILETMNFYKNVGGGLERAMKYSGMFSWEDIRDLARKLGDDPQEIMDYLIKQGYRRNGQSVLKDYRESAEILGRDMSVPTIRWPKNLTTAHDEATKSAAHLKEEIKHPTYRKKTYPKYRSLYEFEEGEYMAMVPEQLSDIKLEGEIQHHCVAGYLDRHAEGKTIIVFIRRVMLPAIPLYTAEISPDGALRQIQGYHNETKHKPTPEADAFVKRWLDEVQRRVAGAKKQKKKEEAA